MNYPEDADAGVSGVVGEMLMIAMVVVLISVFSAALYHFLPTDRDPSITILMSNDKQSLTLWHKGGDFVKTEDLSVIVGNNTWRKTYYNDTRKNPDAQFQLDHPDGRKKEVFDLGDAITVSPGRFTGDETVKLVTPHTVIYTGKVSI